ncbi:MULTISPECIES: DUF1871 family protein [Priestia]|uniref:DUF1871 domain-containing protein n=1 Tax=Priestia megaterium (strain ATCC 12872 / QMB1551) TaxID=545693 RepID=D5E3Q3_PRIM1|nr:MULTISPECIES: DUF1871 family protein [Priestia]ADE72428.1 hypothetical protein BMQ_pBM50089 [Priestia megaterium QM B1551]MBG9930611.1 hypothetical protein [Priestia aryabhattai]MBG9930676.1 hypothetical protein [Priestia aryabhattai]MDF2058542.1 DUF1871 family protein [Priestia megaterium]MDF2064749.1 DUF1871 family protein [Priestia megaterium]
MKGQQWSTRFNDVKETIQSIIYTWNPLSLHASEEYEYEATWILPMVYKVENVESLAIEITDILNQSFNSTLIKEECIGIAQQIWEQIRE